MTTSLSRHEAFLVIFDRVKGVVRSVVDLAQQIEGPASGFVDVERTSDGTCVCFFDYADALQSFDRTVEQLHRPEIASLEVRHDGWDCMVEIRQAVSRIGESLPKRGSDLADHDTLLEAALDLFLFSQILNEYLDASAVGVFGIWGAHWFGLAAENLPTDLVLGASPSRDVPTTELFKRLNSPETDETDSTEAIEARNRWVYEQVMAGVKYDDIIASLREKPRNWQRITTVPGIKGRARAYARTNRLPLPPPRKPGRPRGT